MSEPIIAVERVTKQVRDSTGTLTILHEIDFTLPPRQSAAIVGASGSGKSTLLAIIAGLDTPTSGTVRLAGTDLFTIDEDARAAVRAALAEAAAEHATDFDTLRRVVRRALGRLISQRTRRRPAIIPVVLEV